MKPDDADTLRAWCTLLRAPDIGPSRIRTMIGRAGSALAALAGGPSLWRACDVPASADDALRAPDAARIAADLEWLSEPGHHFVRFDDADYPAMLARTAGAPVALFVAGEPALLWRAQVAIVGSRSATAAGLATARDFAATLANAGFAITSGLADGIDGAAHRAALEADGTTIAICGTGLERVYPRKHRALAREIVAHGALVSELPLDAPPHPAQFPKRNRIIAGLSLGTLVVEAGVQSGSLITARLAGDAGREVFAVPGSIHNPLARGCHRLIRQGAKLVESAQDIVDELGPLARELGAALAERLGVPSQAPIEAGATAKHALRHATDSCAPLLAALGFDALGIDALVERSGLTAPAVSSMLLLLELEGAVAAHPGGRYQRIFQA